MGVYRIPVFDSIEQLRQGEIAWCFYNYGLYHSSWMFTVKLLAFVGMWGLGGHLFQAHVQMFDWPI